MKIKCLSTFLDGADRFEQDDTRTVADERGAYFIEQGWAEDINPDAPAAAPMASPGSVGLIIDSSTVGLGDTNG